MSQFDSDEGSENDEEVSYTPQQMIGMIAGDLSPELRHLVGRQEPCQRPTSNAFLELPEELLDNIFRLYYVDFEFSIKRHPDFSECEFILADSPSTPILICQQFRASASNARRLYMRMHLHTVNTILRSYELPGFTLAQFHEYEGHRILEKIEDLSLRIYIDIHTDRWTDDTGLWKVIKQCKNLNKFELVYCFKDDGISRTPVELTLPDEEVEDVNQQRSISHQMVVGDFQTRKEVNWSSDQEACVWLVGNGLKWGWESYLDGFLNPKLVYAESIHAFSMAMGKIVRFMEKIAQRKCTSKDRIPRAAKSDSSPTVCAIFEIQCAYMNFGTGTSSPVKFRNVRVYRQSARRKKYIYIDEIVRQVDSDEHQVSHYCLSKMFRFGESEEKYRLGLDHTQYPSYYDPFPSFTKSLTAEQLRQRHQFMRAREQETTQPEVLQAMLRKIAKTDKDSICSSH